MIGLVEGVCDHLLGALDDRAGQPLVEGHRALDAGCLALRSFRAVGIGAGGRGVWVALTQKGCDLHSEVHPLQRAVLARMLNG